MLERGTFSSLWSGFYKTLR